MNIEIWSDIACPFCYIRKKESRDEAIAVVQDKNRYQDQVRGDQREAEQRHTFVFVGALINLL
ncbi:hypothetical protein [Paenibacillus taichungensis]|uniref:hypothetical protein n=1 Tax=Paenibacillus taichungensis TaxID=484184 RepID=UPI001586AC9F|nr:hypothetical protein [Paenibacillus taichungensis]